MKQAYEIRPAAAAVPLHSTHHAAIQPGSLPIAQLLPVPDSIAASSIVVLGRAKAPLHLMRLPPKGSSICAMGQASRAWRGGKHSRVGSVGSA